MLLLSAVVALWLGNFSDAVIILIILALGSILGFWQEFTASRAAASLLAQVPIRCRVLRDGVPAEVKAADIVPGDVFILRSGDLIPADARVLEADGLFVVEAALTGEPFPAEKTPATVAAAAALADRSAALWAGTSVRSGTGRAVAVTTGRATVFGGLAEHLEQREAETAFTVGLRRFGRLISEIMLGTVLTVHLFNVLSGKPFLDSMTFALALAIGMTPEMLPAILSMTLARGARRLAAGGAIVKRLSAVENLGAIDVLCTDKTGTLTTGHARLARAVDVDGADDVRVLELAALNARLQTGLANELDAAVVAAAERQGIPAGSEVRLGEVPYDFVRRRVSVVVSRDGAVQIVTKGAVAEVLSICRDVPAGVAARARQWQTAGFRVLALANRGAASADAADESGLELRGFLLFEDPPRADARETVERLRQAGIAVKVVTGDSRHNAAHLAREVGLDDRPAATGPQVARLGADALARLVRERSVFAEVDPAGKERIVAALRRSGHVVGYLGDGINDATALRLADVGVSVEGAVDVARDAADVILTSPDLGRLLPAIEDGRRAFENTMKYIRLTTAANFGNMVSMAAASMVLPFLPLTAGQILLNNLMTDLPALALAGDPVDDEALTRPHRWSLRDIARFMVRFGLISSVFDVLTFVVLLGVFHAGPAEFRTAWFIESLSTELAFTLVIRSSRPVWRSAPGPWLAGVSLAVAALALALPYLPLASRLGFEPPGVALMAAMAAILLAYAAATEAAKLAWRGRPPG